MPLKLVNPGVLSKHHAFSELLYFIVRQSQLSWKLDTSVELSWYVSVRELITSCKSLPSFESW